MTETSINETVSQCLARCYCGGKPFDVLADFMSELKSLGWDASETELFETAALRAIAVKFDSEPRD
jgi:hypothetical protein